MPLLTRFVLPLVLMCIMTCQTLAQSVEVSVCQFMDDKPAAMSLTFDDSLLDHYTVARPLLAEYGYKATFYVVEKYTNQALAHRGDISKRQYMDWQQVKQLADEGHEIGNHSYNHHGLTRIDASRWDEEINHPIATFQDRLGLTPVTFCFPGNARNSEILKLALVNHINARTYQQSFGGKNCTHEKTVQWVNDTIANNKWAVAMIHAIIHEGKGYAPFPNDEKDFVAVLELLKAHEDKLWIDTFANVSKYVKLRDSVTVQWIDAHKTFTLKTELDTKLYDIPLTVKIQDGSQQRLIKVMPNMPTSIQ